MNHPSPERLLHSGQGLWAAYLLQAALELGVFTELGRGPRTLAQLQRRLGLREPGALDLLDALVGLGWLDREGDDGDAVYVNSREASHYLDARSPSAAAECLRDAFASATTAASSLAAALRGDAGWPALPLPEAVLDAWAGMVGEALGQRLSFGAARTLLGVGGGAVQTVCALAAAQPQLQATVLVPLHELASARDCIGARALSARVQARTVPEAWPQADLVVANRWWPAERRSDAEVALARKALAAGGQLWWSDHWLDDVRRHSAPALIAVLRRRLAGDVSAADTQRAARSLCLAVGFARTECTPLYGGLSVVQAFA
jgi:hypothetical protein